MPTLNSSQHKSSITWLDITLIVVLLMIWFLINQVWNDSLAGLMFSLSSLILGLYLTARFTGFLQYIKLSVPTWTISALIAIPVWAFYLTVIPSQSTSSISSENLTQGILTQFFNPDDIIRFMQIWLFPFTESLFIIFLFAFFIGVAVRGLKPELGHKKQNTIIPLFIVASFGSLIHISVASKLEKSGIIKLGASLWQQFLSFFIFAFWGILFLAPGIITSHIVKNNLIFGTFGWWIGIFSFCVAMDVGSIIINRKQGLSLKSVNQFFT